MEFQLRSNEEELSFKVPNDCLNEFQTIEKQNEMRTYFPIVLFIYRDREELESLNPEDIVGKIWVLHLKDKKMSNKILNNYGKCLNNRLLNMTVIKTYFILLLFFFFQVTQMFKH
jgi:hypothetical protein